MSFLLMVMASACQSYREQPVFSPRPAAFVDTTLFEQSSLNCRRSVKDFYRARAFSFFWVHQSIVDSLTAQIERAEEYGLSPHDYHLPELQSLAGDSLSAESTARRDMLLTDAYLSLYEHIRYGRLDPVTLDRRDFSSIQDADAIASMENIRDGSIGKQLQRLEPGAVQYRLLKEALQHVLTEGQADSSDRTSALTIVINMERWRWQKPWPARYVFVNIPSYTLRVIHDDSVWLSSKVIVGKPETPTPTMESIISSFIIYPYWHAPYSIATKEILPLLQSDASYLKRNNFEVMDRRGNLILADTIQWDLYNADYFPFVLRQREGSENSMGIIKFNFANSYGVYLHDTNTKRLFKAATRPFSHGCVRVEQAVALAHYLVHDDDIYVSPEDLDQYLSLQQRLKIDLQKPIPLKLEYFTAEVLDGTLFFYDDIYKKDSVMIRSLFNRTGRADGGVEISSF